MPARDGNALFVYTIGYHGGSSRAKNENCNARAGELAVAAAENEKEKKVVRTIRCDRRKWDAFLKLAAEQGTSGSQAIVSFIDRCLREGCVPTPEREQMEAMAAEIDRLRDRIDRLEKNGPRSE